MYFVLFAFALFLTETYAQVDPLPPNTVLHGQVDLDRWKFYNFSVMPNVGWSLNIEHAMGVNGFHDIDIYVLKEAIPDRSRYDYTDLSLKSEITISGSAQSTRTYYIVGIFGFRGNTTPFTITLQFTNGCPQSCNNRGSCSSGTCHCRTGFTGSYCQYTTAPITLGSRYTNSLNQSQWSFFTVEIFTANNINVYVNQSTADGIVNLYIQWESEPSRFSYQYVAYGYFNRNFNISITEPHLGMWYLGFYANSKSAFSFQVTEARACPMRCSNHGSCVGTNCRCQSDYTGLSCEESRSFINIQGQIYSGYVDQNYWNFYKLVANSGIPVNVLLNHSSSADCDLYVNANSKPTRFIYNYRNITFGPVSNIVIQNPDYTTWWVAIYGVTACTYQLSVQFINTNNCPCVNGQCVEGICRCTPGYIGQTCNQQATKLINGVATPSAVITNGQWIYYQINVTSSQLNVVLQEKTTSGMVWIYIARETSPTLTSYYAADNNSGLSTHRLSIEIVNPQPLTYIIGVYGSPFIPQSVAFSLVAWYPPF